MAQQKKFLGKKKMNNDTQSLSPTTKIPSFDLMQAVKLEGEKFQDYYLWLERAMPRVFFEEVGRENLMLITHSLMGFNLQGYFSTINRKSAAIGLCLDSPDAVLLLMELKTIKLMFPKNQSPFLGLTHPYALLPLILLKRLKAVKKIFPMI
jgi:hypothetical protein